MATAQLRDVVQHLHRLVGAGAPPVADAALLERFVSQRDEVAFELLLRRHGPMVRGICGRLLRHVQDAEDAFQATFLALVKKAGSIRRGSVAGWLYHVAYRICLRARAAAAQRPTSPINGNEPPAPEQPCDLVWRDLRPVLDEEIHRLPSRYSLPIILCYFQGLTHEEAAREMGCPKGTVAVRLMRARQLLHARLTRRGLGLSVSAVASALSTQAAGAIMPAAVIQATLRAAIGLGTGTMAAVSTRAVTLMEGVLRAMLMTKVKATAAAVLLAGGIMAMGVGLMPHAASATDTSAIAPPPARAAAPVPNREDDVVNIPARRSGVVLVLGTEIKDGEKVPAEDVLKVRVDGKERRFRRLKVGDKVEEGQLTGLIDDEFQRLEVRSKKAKVEAAEAERLASEKTRDEAKKRYETLITLRTRTPGALSEEELRGSELLWVRYVNEEVSKAAQVRAAKEDLRAAEKLLSLYEIRAVAGEVRAILFKRAEAVHEYQTVVQIRVGERADRVPGTGAKQSESPEQQKKMDRLVGPIVEPQTTLETVIGQARLVPFKVAPKRIALANESVATYSLVGDKEMLLQGVNVGTTSLYVWFPDPKNESKLEAVGFLVRVVPEPAKKKETDRPREKPAASIGGAGVPPVAPNVPDSPIEGKITSVDVAETIVLVHINIGSDAGLRKGQMLHVYRTTPKLKYLGQVLLTGVLPTEAVGEVIGNNRAPIQAGDIVSIIHKDVPEDGQTYFLHDRKIMIPIHVDPARRQEIAENQVFVSRDHGKTYEQTCKLAPDAKECDFIAPADGDFWFQVQTVDRKGERAPASLLSVPPALRVCVDTTSPVINLEAVRQPGGTVKMLWIVTGTNLVPSSLVLEYRVGGKEEWVSLGAGRALAGTMEWKPETADPVAADPVEMRMTISNKAGTGVSVTVQPGAERK